MSTREVPYELDLLSLHQANPFRYPHLLESAARGQVGRYDILFAFPGESLKLLADGSLFRSADSIPEARDFLSGLDGWWSASAVPPESSELPFRGGWFLYLGYELAGEVEPVLQLPRAPGDLPVAVATRFPAAIIRDHEKRQAWAVAEYAARELLDPLQEDVEQAGADEYSAPLAAGELLEEPADRYLASVRRTLDYIRDGDVFQANLSRVWHSDLQRPAPSHAIYRRLREQNPGPFCGLATWPEGAVISSSPERLVRTGNGVVETRPIAGTRRRGEESVQDSALSDELLGHPKERAEHVMLIDLERNDLGRVCEPGSVEVNELMVLESYAHVHHIVSNVRGRLCSGITPGEVIRAVFPGGTITGCPKVRCMEIIAELEQEGRGPYTGSMGYLNHDGSMDLNILIRTIERHGRRLQLRAGAGIVADSDPEHELDETRAKARGMLLALEPSET